MSTVTNIHDAELSRAAERVKYLLHIGKYSWLEVGRELGRIREKFTSNQEFGQWCKEQEFSVTSNTLFQYRQAADFIDKNTVLVHEQGQIPTDWNVVYKASYLPESQQQEVLACWSRGELLTRSAFDKVYTQETPKKGAAEMSKLDKAVNDTINSMPENKRDSVRSATKKAVELAIKGLHLSFRQKVAEEAEKRVPEYKEAVATYVKHRDEARAEKERYSNMNTDFRTIITMDEFKFVRGFLHPDRFQSQEDQDKANHAFEIFNRLEKMINKFMPIAEKRRYGWAPPK